MNDDWGDFLQALSDAGARFLIVGAHAMALHGVPRGTQDLDIWIDSTAANAERVWRALAAFGAPLADLRISSDDLHRPDSVIQVGLPPYRIDLMTTLSGIADFESAWIGRVEHAFAGRAAPFLGREDLVRNKRAAARRKDLADLEALGELPPAD